MLAVPLGPEPPQGSPESIRVFHAGRQYYSWSVLVWATRTTLIFAALAAVSAASTANISRAPGWGQIVWTSLVVLGWIVFVVAAFVTFVARRLNYRLRCYIVTDRSLRIRSVLFSVKELTMTYGSSGDSGVARCRTCSQGWRIRIRPQRSGGETAGRSHWTI